MIAPVVPSRRNEPIVAMNRWRRVKRDDRTSLTKTYSFDSMSTRNEFVRTVMGYESKTGHAASIAFDEHDVSIELWTKDVNIDTELDASYARFADFVYDDVVGRGR